jgi:hypothetical protein
MVSDPTLAGVLAVITIPAHLIGLRQPWPPAPQRHAAGPPNHIARSRGFVALTIAFALATGASYAIIVNLIPLMAERGISAQVAPWHWVWEVSARCWAGWATAPWSATSVCEPARSGSSPQSPSPLHFSASSPRCPHSRCRSVGG